ncbi:hypothetical protein O181_077189 [Austropuccinia psidii MF-1]|uniref:Uncharacterized protein n=1 Tax=Austropuccinia psidii MF-1 TaxID=1389203 RepID=A0A9Q3IG39_9BASI|nr:hypothetical protein [Austropuccinia psidii MF-1]
MYDGYKAVKLLDPSCTECLAKGRDCIEHFNPKSSKCHFGLVGKKPCHFSGPIPFNVRRYLWSKKDGPFGEEFPVSEGPTPDGTSRNPDCSDELDGEEFEVVDNPVGHQSRTSPSQPLSKTFQSCLIPSALKNFQPTLATIPTSLPPASPSSSNTSSAMIPAVRPSPIQQSRDSPIVTSQQPQ